MGARAVFLVGFMGSGKNTVGQELARRLGWEFVDLDAQIEHREHQTIPAIFRAKGEPGFRLAESAALREFLGNPRRLDSVIALGGGAFVQENNRALLCDWPTVFLDAPADELWRRCQQDAVERPLRRDHEQFARLYRERLPFYRQASLVIETHGKDPAAICAEIERALRLIAAPEDATSKSSRQPDKGRATPSSSSTKS
jgi:shikimate kinase